MKVLRLVYRAAGADPWTEFTGTDGELKDHLNASPKSKFRWHSIRLEFKVNAFGRWRVEKPQIYNCICEMVNDGNMPFVDHDMYKPAGWLAFAELGGGSLKAQCPEIIHMLKTVNEYTEHGFSSELLMNYGTDEVKALTRDNYNLGWNKGLDWTGHKFDLSMWNWRFGFATLDNCEFKGDLSCGQFYTCRMIGVSFKGARFYNQGCRLTSQNNSLHGCKYTCNIVSEHDSQQQFNYDIHMLPNSGEAAKSVLMTDDLFLNKKVGVPIHEPGFNIITAEKPVLVSQLKDGEKDAPVYVPKPGKILTEHLKHNRVPGSPLPEGQAWYSNQITVKANMGVCALTGLRYHNTRMGGVVVEYSLAQRLDLPSGTLCSIGVLTGISYGASITIFPTRLYPRCSASNFHMDVQAMVRHGGRFYHPSLAPRDRIRAHNSRHNIAFYTVDGEVSDSNIPFFGFELEVEMQQDEKKINALTHVSDEQKERIRCKSDRAFNEVVDKIISDKFFLTKGDGSLQFGYEIVTQPFSWGWWNSNRDSRIQSLLTTLQNGGYISHDSGRAGLHVHIARRCFQNQTSKDGKFTGSLHLWRFSRMIYCNPQFSIWLSRRGGKDQRYAKINPVEFDNSKSREILTHSTSCIDRYSAINYCNQETVEVRMFRGTLNFKSFCSSLEFCHALWAYTLVPTNPLDIQSFMTWVARSVVFDKDGVGKAIYPYLSGLLKHKKDEIAKALKKEWTYASEGWEEKLPPRAVKAGAVPVAAQPVLSGREEQR